MLLDGGVLVGLSWKSAAMEDICNTELTAATLAAKQIADITGIARHDIAVTLGSGWVDAVSNLGELITTIPAQDIHGFFPPVLAGHSGVLTSIRLTCGVYVLVIGARTHLYQGHGPEAVVHGIKTAHAAGARVAILTNGAGSTVPDWGPGEVVVIKDHINLTGKSPLSGANFCDMSDIYTAALRQKILQMAPNIPQGVYAQMPGPQYETPAEVKMLRTIGADLVGMSTALEAIMAKSLKMNVVGLSLVTNLAAGIGTGQLSHDEVLTVSEQARQKTSAFLVELIRDIGQDLSGRK
ncbi:MAG: purine-nucleoside phosphorylase [Tropheryma whipplei]|uniref:Purine nucleoside phosphorylase n=2 Tax=Tropheryma whipplei TaxID=2039 RepID=Q83H43_TROWT|nr:purine-nucleoside phosphorylase [Tropheryma whipplei]AAO44115.1 purine nucleoside phosphorylase [Tropheryma whipplei str. Twist]MCO8182828.1 purine-nucleoside phosphorylase [Tropheryma whipplei]MCO8190494.1 purine-nucleoside phosphorylase [Tropheryma whipplei]